MSCGLDHRRSTELMIRMTGANMNLVTVNVKLGENDPEPEPKLEPVSVSLNCLGLSAEIV